MASFFKYFASLTFCAAALIVWFIQPDRSLLQDIEKEIGVMASDEVERRMGELGFQSQTATYFALAARFSRGDGSQPIVFISPEVRQAFLTVCPIECQVTTSEKRELIPLLGMDRRYKFHTVVTDAGKVQVLPDRAFWIMYLP